MLSYRVEGQASTSDSQTYAVTVEASYEDQTTVIIQSSQRNEMIREVFFSCRPPKYQAKIPVPYVHILWQHHVLRKCYQK